MSGHATIKDVAKKAGVSITTVSFVLNKRPDVTISDVVRKRVLECAQELEYHPSALAAGLAGRRTRNLGVVFGTGEHSFSNPFYSFVVEGIIQTVVERGFNLLFARLEGAYEGIVSLPKFVREKNCDGVILIGRVEPRLVADLQERKTPLVLLDNFPRIEGVNNVQIDNRRGGILAAEHLVRLGHKNIYLLTAGGREKRPMIQEREEGFFTSLAQAGLRLPKENTLECEGMHFHAAYERTLEFFKRVRKNAAIFAVNDEMAAGVLRAAVEAGRSVPSELSVIGFDNILMSYYTVPPLTTVSVAKEHMGRLAAERVLDMVENKDRTVKKELAPVELIGRDSTAKATGH
jgi:LacI family transcriptional regulator